MIYRIRFILDVEEDVLRDLEIESDSSLEVLHDSICQAFGFLGNEMASFYETNDRWEQGDEIPLLTMDPEIPSHADSPLETFFSADNHKLIYVYDFFNLWTFFVELMEVGEPTPEKAYPSLIYAQGEVPEEAPEKSFEGEIDEEDALGFDEDMEEDGLSDYDDSSFY